MLPCKRCTHFKDFGLLAKFLVPTWPPKSIESYQVVPSWSKLGSSWPNLGPSWAKFACQIQGSMYKFTKCGSNALLERNLAQHNANMARKPSRNSGPGGVRAPVFRSVFVLDGLLAPRGHERGPRRPKRAPRVNFERILGGFGKILEEFWGGFGMIFCWIFSWPYLN